MHYILLSASYVKHLSRLVVRRNNIKTLKLVTPDNFTILHHNPPQVLDTLSFVDVIESLTGNFPLLAVRCPEEEDISEMI